MATLASDHWLAFRTAKTNQGRASSWSMLALLYKWHMSEALELIAYCALKKQLWQSFQYIMTICYTTGSKSFSSLSCQLVYGSWR